MHFRVVMAFKNLSTLFIIVLVENFNLIHSQSNVSLEIKSSETCPPNFELRNGLCYPTQKSNLSRCPPEYFFHIDGLCYPNERKPCPTDKVNKTEELLTTTNVSVLTTTTASPYPAQIIRFTCPNGSIMYRNKCRKVICSLGEYYRGACHRPICPPGLVWRGKQCQKPVFVTTVIEIDNTFVNEINEKPFAVEIKDHNTIISQTTTLMPPHANTSHPGHPAFLEIKETSVTKKPHLSITTESYKINNFENNETCCLVITPRICKKYLKWHCFNRKYTICENRICTEQVLYLKAPEVKYESPILVMPPNPQLGVCKSNNCNTDADIVDCSGCVRGHIEKCSPYCYSYICSNKTCNFMNLKDFCTLYSGRNGCIRKDGCLWNWCTRSE